MAVSVGANVFVWVGGKRFIHREREREKFNGKGKYSHIINYVNTFIKYL